MNIETVKVVSQKFWDFEVGEAWQDEQFKLLAEEYGEGALNPFVTMLYDGQLEIGIEVFEFK